ncbi:MAG: RagB/SusD family nutrient uptake outer membrane protein [Dysgonamonadaceae bacterium]|jgi:hypothetical protein|nr:RagB/SusD family nutrient uptake outer membrane protein [Dysgonamonadaceae bacterium]
MKTTKIIPSLCGILLSATSCNDFLSKNPDNRADLDSPANIAGLLVSAYPQYSAVWFTEVMSDNATDAGAQAPADIESLRQAYYWERVDEEEQDSPNGYWYACYEAIAAANHALEAIENLSAAGYSPTELNPLKGEALLCRAYAHFMLVNLFAEHYHPAAADSTSGITYITRPETSPYAEYSRHSVQEVYTLIEQDLQDGFPLIKDAVHDAPKWHFNRQAAATFISRYYLYRGLPGDWDEVIRYAGIALEDNPAAFLREWIESSKESFDVFGMTYSRSSNPANFLVISTVSTAYRAWYHRYTMDLPLIRKRVAAGSPHPTTVDISGRYALINKAAGNAISGCYGVFKYAEVFKRDGINADYGLPYIMNTPLVAEEALFNRLEAEVMQERYDKVIEWLDLYYATRVIDYDAARHKVTDDAIRRAAASASQDITPHYALNEKQKTYLKCLVNIRASEFVSEGQRWFDIKRMHLPVVHAIAGGGSVRLEANDRRRVIPFPPDATRIRFPGRPAQPNLPADSLKLVMINH